jgi:hypothetical protein
MGHKERGPVTQLRKKVLEELERRNYSKATAHAYVGATRRFAEDFHRSPDQLDPEQIREYQRHRVHRGLATKTVMIQMAAPVPVRRSFEATRAANSQACKMALSVIGSHIELLCAAEYSATRWFGVDSSFVRSVLA